MATKFRPRITMFHCINAINGTEATSFEQRNGFDLKTVKLPCSSMVKDVYLLRAFEAGADAAIVLVCPEGQCRHIEGNLRARKRVARLKGLLDEIGLGGRRLQIYNTAPEDKEAAGKILQNTLSELESLGPNPASKIS